jgi:type I restriction enzyme S subunit
MRIDEIFSFEKGILQSSKCVPGDFDFITASSDWKTHNEYTHDCEALIFAAAASGSLGRTHYVNGKFVSSDLCFIITPKDQENLPVDLKFYHILFNELKDEIVRNTKAGTSKEAIGLGSFGKYELPYFDIDIQIEIKNQFVNSEEIKSSLTTELNQQVSLVKKLRQQLLQDAVQGKLVEQNKKDEPASELLRKIKAEKEKLIAEKKLKKEKDLPPIKPEEIPFDIPKNWRWCRLNDIISILGDGLHGTPNYDTKGDYFFVNGNNLINGKIEVKENTKRVSEMEYLRHRKTLTLSTVFVSINGTIGNLAYYNDEKIILGKSACYFNLHPKIIREYIGIFIRSNYFLKYAVDVASETTIKNVSLKSMRLLPIPLPPLSEQNRIVHKLDELMQHCNELEASIKQSESQNKKLLQRVLREALRKGPIIEKN